MLNRVYFPRSWKFIVKGRRVAHFGADCCLLGGIFVLKFGRNTSYTNRLVSTKSIISSQRGLLTLSRRIPVALRLRYYQRGSADSTATGVRLWKKRLWMIVRGVLLATGGFVWLVAFTAYVALDKVTVDVLENESNTAANALQKELAKYFYQENHRVGIIKKENALDEVWQKLSQEEHVKEIFGEPVYICGYNYKFVNDAMDSGHFHNKVDEEKVEGGDEQEERNRENCAETSEDLTWEAGCYIEGPKRMGIMDVKFENYKQEWVPVSLSLETLEKTGQVVSDVSSSLPNGIKNFTRLSN